MNLPGCGAHELFESVWRDNPEIARAEAAMGSRLTLARNVLRLRVSGGLTRHQMAQRLGTSQPRVAQIEAAQANVTIDTLDRIADAFSMQTATLFKRAYRSRSHAESASAAETPIESLEPEDPEDDAVEAEAHRRAMEMVRGVVEGLDGDEVIAGLRARPR